MKNFLIIFIFLLISSCGDESDPIKKDQGFSDTFDPQNLPGGVFPVENSDDSSHKLDVFPVLLDEVFFNSSKKIKVYKGNDALDYLIKEKYVSEKILNKKHTLEDMGALSRSILVRDIDRKINRLKVRFRFDEKVLSGRSNFKLRSVRLSVFRKRMLEENFSYYGDVKMDFLKDYGREISTPLFFNDQNYEVVLPKPLFPETNDLYLFRITKAEFFQNGISRSLVLDDAIEKDNHCYYSVLNAKYYLSSKQINCIAVLGQKQKIVLDQDAQKIVSINNYNNNFLIDPPTFKLEFNNLDTYGYFSSTIDAAVKDFFILFFKYEDLFEVVPYEKMRELTLSQIETNSILLRKLTKFNINFNRVKIQPIIKNTKRTILVRSLGSRPGDADYFHIESNLRTHVKQSTEKKSLKKSRSFKINEKLLEEGSYFIDKENVYLENKIKKLAKSKYELGDSANVGRYKIISSEYVKKHYRMIDNDSYEEAFLEVFLPSW